MLKQQTMLQDVSDNQSYSNKTFSNHQETGGFFISHYDGAIIC